MRTGNFFKIFNARGLVATDVATTSESVGFAVADLALSPVGSSDGSVEVAAAEVVDS